MKHEENRYSLPKEKRDKGYTLLFIAFIIVFVIAIALAVSLIAANAKNDKLEKAITEKDQEITTLKAEVTKKDGIIVEYDALQKRLRIQIDECVAEISRLLTKVNFLTPWATKIADRLEKTVDFRPLTIFKCDNIACWLFKQVKKFREFEKEGER